MASNAEMTQYYFDHDEGMNRDNCHPRYAKLAPDDFYYDGCNDFSPFGSDAGHDTLSALQDWYQHGGRNREIASFVRGLFEEWDYPVPDNIWRAEPAEIEPWLALEPVNECFLTDEWRVRVAAAFGQLRISGEIEPGMLDEALLALRCQCWYNERARVVNPEWEYADIEKEHLLAMQAVLEQVYAGAAKR
ncbi:MolR family transcriptional regulator [Massilia genomosp. 1]|uniref:MolR family transcriptional regulator n=1 Tax=Massilia genomosp. 1 TaxID=2609280 RepID=A0ABX0MWN2_9BURK|nr:MolR family transcriptional regulator [Massilia genomosp. 1]NHZ64473.1 MolR family transcriptional regulator [Massilia genomosp. 1]